MTRRFAGGPLRGRGANHWSPRTFLLVDYRWLGDGFPIIVLKGHGEPLNLGSYVFFLFIYLALSEV